MSSPDGSTQGSKSPTPGAVSQSQIVELPVGGSPSGQQPTSVTASQEVVSQTGESSTDTATTVASSPTQDFSLSKAVSVPTNPAMETPTLSPPNGTANDPLQDPVRAKFVTSPVFVPTPSFSYSVFPRVTSPSGSHQPSLSTPAVKLTPPMPVTALQPPVPGSRPSFSYNVVSNANTNSSSGQMSHPASLSSQTQIQGGKFSSVTTAASLQPPVPRQSFRPSSTVPGAVAQNVPPLVRLPFSIPKGQLPSSNFSFNGNSQPGTVVAPEKNVSPNMHTSNPVTPEAGTHSATSVSSQPIQFLTNMPTSTSTATVPSPNLNSSSVRMPAPPSFMGRPAFQATVGTPTLPRVPNSVTFSSNVPIHQITTDPSQTNLRAAVPPPASVPSHLVSYPVQAPPQNVQQHNFPPYLSVPSMPPPPQALWLNPPQTGGLQRAPFVPYPGVRPAPLPFPMRGMPLSTVPFPNVQPPGVSSVVANEATVPTTAGLCQPANSSGSGSPPRTENDKQADDLHSHNDGVVKSEDGDAWTSHKTESGIIYYYNSITKESTYVKPSSFKGEPAKVTVQTTPVSWEKLAGTNWTLVTTNDGKNYYYDEKTKVSSWQVPPEVIEMRRKKDNEPKESETLEEKNSSVADNGAPSTTMSAPAAHTGGRESVALRSSGAPVSSSALDLVKKKLQDAGAPIASSPIPVSPLPSISDVNSSKASDSAVKEPQTVNSKDKVKDANEDGNMSDSSSDTEDESGPTKDECLIQFKEMLKERGVAPFSKWDKELPKIVFDPRFKAVPGYSTRRSLFEHYVRTRAEEERKEKRAAQKATLDSFKQLLEEASEDIDHKTDYQSFKRKWGSDPRFEALDRKERELLLNEKVLSLKKAFKEKVQVGVTSFKSMLRDNSDITTSSRWSKVKDSLRNDPRYKSVKHEDRELLFNEYISELKAAEEETERAAKSKRDEQEKVKERERELRKRKEREEQEMERVRVKVRRKEAVSSYQALLVETIKDPKASWTESKPKLEKDPQSRATNPDLSPSDMEKLFRDHVRDLYERCAREYLSLLSETLTPELASRSSDEGKNVLNSWSEAKHLLKSDPRYVKMPRKERETLWERHAEELMRKQKSTTDPKEMQDSDGRNRTSSSVRSRRSPRRPHGRK